MGITVMVLAPMRPELRPLVKRLALRATDVGGVVVHEGSVGDVTVRAVETGIGLEPARLATERGLDATSPDHVIVMGVAGGISPDLAIGDLVVPEVVVDGVGGTEFAPAPVHVTAHGRLLTSDALFTDKSALPQLIAEGVLAVDMETSAVAAVCTARGIPWSVFRTISDKVEHGLVDAGMLSLAGSDGRPKAGAVARYVARRPWHAPRLVRIGRDAQVATAAAAAAVIAFCEGLR